MDNISKLAQLVRKIADANLPGLGSLRFLMTRETYDEIQSSLLQVNNCDSSEYAAPGSNLHAASFDSITGIPYEVLNTTRECLDRALELGPTAQPILILLEPIPADCMDHPVARMLTGSEPSEPFPLDASIMSSDGPKFDGMNFGEVFGRPGRRNRGNAPHIN